MASGGPGPEEEVRETLGGENVILTPSAWYVFIALNTKRAMVMAPRCEPIRFPNIRCGQLSTQCPRELTVYL